MQITLLIKILPRIPQIKRHRRHRRTAKALIQIRIRKPILRNRRLLIPKRAVRPLPSDLAIGLDEPSRGVQVVGLDGVVFCAVNRRNWHGAAGCGEVDVSGALAPARDCATCEGVGNQRAIFVINVAHARFLDGGAVWVGAGVPEALEEGGEGFDHRLRGGGVGVGDGE